METEKDLFYLKVKKNFSYNSFFKDDIVWKNVYFFLVSNLKCLCKCKFIVSHDCVDQDPTLEKEI